MKRSYDIIAPIYDNLAKLIFGKAIRKAQVYFLSQIPYYSNILIVGGGTGWILEEMAAICQQNLVIDYIDVSEKMIRLSKQRNIGTNKVDFIHQSIFHFTGDKRYDVIITPFFFDNFKQEKAQQAFALLHQKVKPNGIWLYTDFQIKKESPYWQKILLFVMYRFFRLAANIEATRLPNVASCFNQHNYHLIKTETFLHGFIFTSLYKKLIPGS